MKRKRHKHAIMFTVLKTKHDEMALLTLRLHSLCLCRKVVVKIQIGQHSFVLLILFRCLLSTS